MTKDSKRFFNETYKNWQKTISPEMELIISRTMALLNVNESDSVLDVGCGTGVLYDTLMKLGITHYLGLDISDKMLASFHLTFPDASTRIGNFDAPLKLDSTYDLCLIFNSIPHFENMEVVFENAFNLLKPNGKFAIVHGRTRKQLALHHQKINYQMTRDAIPSDFTLMSLCKKYGFEFRTILDMDFFYFECVKAL